MKPVLVRLSLVVLLDAAPSSGDFTGDSDLWTGRHAVIGAVVEDGANAGYSYAQYFVDRGGPGLGDRDLASPSFFDPLDSSVWPAGFRTPARRPPARTQPASRRATLSPSRKRHSTELASVKAR